MISLPAEWCSPIHASSNPSVSMCSISSRSASSDKVGLCSGGWNGAIKLPNRIRIVLPFVATQPSEPVGSSQTATLWSYLVWAKLGSHAGPEPDEVNMPHVASALTDQDFTIDWQPERVTADHTERADLLVSIGCDHNTTPATAEVPEWDVLLISQDLLGSLQAIRSHTETLAKTLAAS